MIYCKVFLLLLFLGIGFKPNLITILWSFLQAVVNMFLLEGVSLADKQIIVFYLLCDLVNSAPEEVQAKVFIGQSFP